MPVCFCFETLHPCQHDCPHACMQACTYTHHAYTSIHLRLHPPDRDVHTRCSYQGPQDACRTPCIHRSSLFHNQCTYYISRVREHGNHASTLHECTSPLPVLSGLHSCCTRLLCRNHLHDNHRLFERVPSDVPMKTYCRYRCTYTTCR